MQDLDKKEFWSMMNVTMELTNHPPLSKEAIVVWFNFLQKHELKLISNAIDSWLKTSNRTPAPKDILELCKPIQEVYKSLPPPLSKAANKKHADEVVEFIAKNMKPRKDYKAWIIPILKDPSNFPDISFRYAKEVQKEMKKEV